jgi:predicted alpha/beta hydrolase family esterase
MLGHGGGSLLDEGRVLILPGWQNSGPGHWQSRWEALHGYTRVEQADWDWPRRGDWMAQLDEVLQASSRPALLVAHSLGCHLVAAWAAHSRHIWRVQAALLVAPPDTEREDMPSQVFNWRPIVRQRLPFPATLLYSEHDPYCSAPRSRQMAADWGAAAVSLGASGHVNGDSGLGDWPDGLAHLARLAERVG